MADKNQDSSGEITLRCQVDAYRSGWTLLEFLVHRFRYLPEARWRGRIDEGRVTVNEAHVPADHRLQSEDVIAYRIRHIEPPVDAAYTVVYEDDHVLAVSKSGNLPVHASGVFIRNTLIAILRERYGDTIALGHRLDRETSGLVVLSKDRATARALSRMFAKGSVQKTYVTVVHGHVEQDEFDVDAPIGKVLEPAGEFQQDISPDSELAADAPRFVARRRIDFADGKPAQTHFRVVRRFERDGQTFTVLEARPVTGRTNQIRVHLAHVGHPILGDKSYGNRVADRALNVVRQLLHCEMLQLVHPATGRTLILKADRPHDIAAWADQD